MPFKPVTKEERTASEEFVNVNLKLVGAPAGAFKAMMESTKLSGADLIAQMAQYCLKDHADGKKT